MVEEVLKTPVHILILTLVLEESVHQSQVVAVLTDELALRISGFHHLVLRPQEDVRSVQTSDDGQNFIDAVVLRRSHEHLGQLRLQRKLSHLLALRCKVALIVQRSQVVEQFQRPHEGFGGRRVHEIEMDEIVDAQLLQRQDSRRQVRPQNLRVSILDQFFVVGLLSVQSETFARLRSACSTCPLLGAGFADGRNQQTFHPHPWVEHLLLGKPWIDDVYDPINRNTSLRDVSGHYNLAPLDALLAWFGRIFEYPLLLMRRKRTIERDNGNRPHLIAEFLDLLLDFSAGRFDFLLPRQKQQNIALPLVLMDGHCRADGSLDVVALRLLAEVHVDGVHSTGDVESGGAAEVLLELDCVHGGGHDDEFEVRPAGEDLLDESEQHVGVERALVGLIEDDHRVPLQIGVDHGLPQQHTVRHVLEDGPLGSQILKTDGIPHLLAQLHVQLLTDPLRHRHRRHPPRLRAGNPLATAGIPRLNEKLRNLRGFPRPSLPHQNEHLILRKQRQQFRFGVEGGQSASGFEELEVVRGVGFVVEVVGVGFDPLGEAVLRLLLAACQFLPHKLKHSIIIVRTVQSLRVMDCHQVVAAISRGEVLPEATVRMVASKFAEVLAEEGNLLHLAGPFTIVGDVHGQFYDVQRVLQLGGPLPANRYLFLGDYVDRGYHSLETILLLACCKILYPSSLYLLRGNHESRQISSTYGFYEETLKKYGSPTVWKLFNETFDYLPLAALLNHILCLHGGLSPDLHALEEIDDIDRVCEIPTAGPFGDLVWSDPEQIENWCLGSRGVGWLFGSRVVSEFNEHNWLKLIVRSHQLVEKGWQEWFKGKLVTVWSAPNYCYRCANAAAVMRVGEDGAWSYETFREDPRSQIDALLSVMRQLIICFTMEISLLKKTGEFLLYSLAIYACYISSAVYHEKILKHPYVDDTTQQSSTFNAAIIFTFFPPLVCTLIGFVLLQINTRCLHAQPTPIPPLKAAICSAIVTINMLTYNQAVIEASFPAVVMVKSCSLLSVILVGIFCSRVKDKQLQLGKSKILIGVVVTIGIVMFNLFKQNEGGSDKPLSYLSCGLLLVSLMGDGLLPDFQAQIKSEFKPGVLDMYFHINKFTALIALLYAAVTLQIPYIFHFILNHREFQTDLLLFSLLNAVGQLVIYRMIKLFKQHIPAFVIATRKCFTVIVSILHFDHQINFKQGIGMLLVFAAVILEVYDNYLEKNKPEPPVELVDSKNEEEEKEQLSGEFEVRFPTLQPERTDQQNPN